MVTATVSGSFHRFMVEIERAVRSLMELGVRVVSPADPRVVGALGEFLFVASDRVRSVRLVQDRHLESIAASDFLWLVCPDGYVGQSAAMELGFAVAKQIPIFGNSLPSDLTLRQYVKKVSDIKSAVAEANASSHKQNRSFLIDPHASIQVAHRMLERIDREFQRQPSDIEEEAAVRIYSACADLRAIFDDPRVH